jgi:hypothetical protein
VVKLFRSIYNNQFSITEKNGAEGTFSPYIGMKTADNKYIPWLASQTDMLAEDWGNCSVIPIKATLKTAHHLKK